ncbi:MAG: hypothetical protein JRH15_03335 [Deltaproteobacteria bacterium]|nr:hypothetical protein [Deltaproteobacteria bacterium]
MSERNRGLPIIVLEGKSPRERGRAHGETLKDMIREHRDRWEQNMHSDTGLDMETYLAQLLSETNFIPAIKRWTPGLLEEVRGIAEGAGIDFRYVLARQLSDEEPWYRREKKMAMTSGRGCSSIGLNATDRHPTMIGQNMDTPVWYDGHQTLFHHKGPDLPVEIFNLAVPGKINLCGMNSNGVSICCNTLSQLDYSKKGLPEDFVVRGFLEQPILEKGLEFIHAISHASGQNYVIAEPGSRAINLEASANKVVEYKPTDITDRLVHTNHPLVNDDQGIYRKAMGVTENSDKLMPAFAGSTIPRFEELDKRLNDPAMQPTIDDMKAAFSSHEGPVCRHPDDSRTQDVITLGCMIMELSSSPVFHIAPGPPCTTPFKTYHF